MCGIFFFSNPTKGRISQPNSVLNLIQHLHSLDIPTKVSILFPSREDLNFTFIFFHFKIHATLIFGTQIFVHEFMVDISKQYIIFCTRVKTRVIEKEKTKSF